MTSYVYLSFVELDIIKVFPRVTKIIWHRKFEILLYKWFVVNKTGTFTSLIMNDGSPITYK